MSSHVRSSDSAPRAWVLNQCANHISEVWVLRQLRRFQRLSPQFLYWERQDRGWYTLDGVDVLQVPFPVCPHEGPGRWYYRARQVFRQNFYGAVGKEYSFLENLAAERKPNVILAHFGHMGLRVLPLAQSRNIPLVVHFHGHDLSSGLRNRWYRWSLERNLEWFSASIVVGSHQRKLLMDMGLPEDRIHLIPCGVPMDEFPLRSTPAEDGPVRFVSVSRLVPSKGVRESVTAFAELVRACPNAEYRIVGDGPERPSLTELVGKLGLDGQVHIMGPLPPDQKDDVLRQADVFLQHSLLNASGWVEGFGVSAAEAAATGLPVVVTSFGGLADQVVDGETGFIVAPGDVVGMAAAMRKLAQDPELRRRMGQAGRERMAVHFDTARQVAKLEDVLLSVAR